MLASLKKWIGEVAIASGAAALVGTWFSLGHLPPQTGDPLVWWLLVGLTAVLTFAWLVMAVLGSPAGWTAQRATEFRGRPQLVIQPSRSDGLRLGSGQLADVVHVHVRNEAQRSRGDAVNVSAELTLSGPHGTIGPIRMKPRSQDYGVNGQEPRVTIPARGQEEFDVADRIRGDDDAYLHNSESAVSFGGKRPDWRLTPGTYRLEFQIFHDAGTARRRLTLSNEGNGPLRLVDERGRPEIVNAVPPQVRAPSLESTLFEFQLRKVDSQIASFLATSTDLAAWDREAIYYRNSTNELIAEARNVIRDGWPEHVPYLDDALSTPVSDAEEHYSTVYRTQLLRVRFVIEQILKSQPADG